MGSAKIVYDHIDSNVKVNLNGDEMKLHEAAEKIEESMEDLRYSLAWSTEGKLEEMQETEGKIFVRVDAWRNIVQYDISEIAEKYVDGFYETNGKYYICICENGEIKIFDNYSNLIGSDLGEIVSDFEITVENSLSNGGIEDELRDRIEMKDPSEIMEE